MPAFVVTYEDVAFAQGAVDTDGLGMSETHALSFTETARAEGLLTGGVVAVLGASTSIDDSVYKDGIGEDGQAKLFVSVRLRVEAEDVDAAEDADVPAGLLSRVADALPKDLAREGNWEFADVEPEDIGPTP